MTRLRIGDRVTICDGSGLMSGKSATVIHPREIPLKQTGGGLIPDLEGYYSPVDWKKEVALRYDNGELGTMFKERCRLVGALDCGHLPTRRKKGSCATGVCHDRETGKTMCYACANKAQRKDLKTATKFQAYLSGDGKCITTWSGGKLATVTSTYTTRRGFCGSCVWWHAKDVHGVWWYGAARARGWVTIMRRFKNQDQFKPDPWIEKHYGSI